MQKALTYCLWLLLFSAATPMIAQVSKDATVPLSAVVSTTPASVTLTWPTPVASTLRVLRRLKGQTGTWTSLLNAANSTQTTLTDATVTVGQTYEYRVERISNVAAYGYAHVAVEAPVTDSRGKVLLFIDAALVTDLAPEISRLKNDLRGDGWQVVEHITAATATVKEVKALIVSDYNADPTRVKSVLLLGSIPIPYSGNTQWDGHPDHAGAWPADAYYTDVITGLGGSWTDATVNNITPSRTANHNIPGDGKFDQNYIPTSAELSVGRIDFRRIDAAAFGATNTTDLYRRYLNKNHDWRAGIYQTEKKALVDDNFGYFNGEAFAANGFRNAYPLVGEANIVQTDFFNNTNPQRWLLGYGTGGGTYTSANNVGSSSNFATDTVHIVFSNLFGSYHGDWDFETNPFMPSALASRGGILTCGWAGRPHHYLQALASGESIGFCMRETLNATYNPGYHPTQAEGGAHVSLLGDPTLRAHIVAPAQGLALAQAGCTSLTLAWTAAVDTDVVGYHIYRSTSPDGPYERLTFDPLAATTYTDATAPEGTLYYSVRSVKKETSPGGGIYWNTGTGAPLEVNFAKGTPPEVAALGGIITCLTPAPTVTVTSSIANSTFLWTGPNNFSSQLPNPTVTEPGIYVVLVTAPSNCTATATAVVTKDVEQTLLNLPTELKYNCSTVCAAINLPSLPNTQYEIDNQPINNLTQEFCNAGQYTITIINSQNGCRKDYPLEVIADVNEPGAVAGFSGSGIINCLQPFVSLAGNSSTAGVIYRWIGPNAYISNLQNPLVGAPGKYVLTVTNPANGCTSSDEVSITSDLSVPTVSAPPLVISCANPSGQLCVEVSPLGTTWVWTGPGGFTSTDKCIAPSQSGGPYLVTTTHPTSGCTATTQTSISLDVAPPLLNVTVSNPLNCTNSTATLCAESNTPGVTFNWFGPEPSTQICVTTSVAGDYVCVATAPNGCTSSISANVLQAPPLTIEVPTIPISCGEAVLLEIKALGGTPPYRYLWSTGDTTAMVTLSPNFSGNLSCAVSDSGGCKAEFGPVSITPQPPIGLIVSRVNESMPGAKDGSATVTASGGTAGFSYLWSNEKTTSTITGLSGGTYTVTVTDAVGCTAVAEVEVKISSSTDESNWLTDLSLSPNPTEGFAQLTLRLQEPEAVRLSIHDTAGRLIFEEKMGAAQIFSQKLDLSGQPAGVYLVRVQAGEQTALRRVVKQ